MTPYYADEHVTIYHGDARDVLPTLEPVSLIFTDPPYPNEFDYVWDILGDVAPAALSPGKSLLTYCGHYQVPRVIEALSRHLRFNWLCIQRNHGANPRMFGPRVMVTFKPVLWFTKGAIERGAFMSDELAYDTKGILGVKQKHEWGQPVSLLPVLRLTEPGDVVLDPFMGSGTTLAAAKNVQRRAIGIEIEERYCEIAAKRCAQEVFAL